MNQDEYRYHLLWLEAADYAAQLADKYGLVNVNKAGIERVSSTIAEFLVEEKEARGRVFPGMGL